MATFQKPQSIKTSLIEMPVIRLFLQYAQNITGYPILRKERITMNAIEKMLCLLVLLPCITRGLLLMSRGEARRLPNPCRCRIPCG